jgi:cell division protease FtsH
VTQSRVRSGSGEAVEIHRFRLGYFSAVISCVAAILFVCLDVTPASAAYPEVTLDQIALAAKQGNIDTIVISGSLLKVKFKDGRIVQAYKEDNLSVADTLKNFGVTDQEIQGFTVRVDTSGGDTSGWLVPLVIFVPMALFFGVMIVTSLRARSKKPDAAVSFAKSKPTVITGTRPDVTFQDVAGEDEAKQELQEIVEFLRTPSKFAALGARTPKGVLLVGSPGTGKTLLARAVAGEAGVPFFSISGSEFVEIYVGVGASRVRDLFDQAKKAAPSILFIDEIDAVGRHRGTGIGGGNDEREQTLNQILVEMDGFDQGTNIVVIAATNRPDILDQALLRPGRFDRRVTLDAPDLPGRVAILKVHTKNKPLAPEVDLETVAKQTVGFTGADLANLMNESAILVARRDGESITMKDIEEAVDRVIAGPERKGRIISPKEKLITAYHEAGHALVAYMLPYADPVYKITIVSRGMSGGHTRLMPAEDRHLYTKSQLRDNLAYGMGGMAAESTIFGQITTGPGNDLVKVTQMAAAMVCEYGMSESLGALVCMRREDERPNSQYGEELADAVDDETEKLLNEALSRAKDIIEKNRSALTRIAEGLVEKETIKAEELAELIGLPKAMPQVA